MPDLTSRAAYTKQILSQSSEGLLLQTHAAVPMCDKLQCTSMDGTNLKHKTYCLQSSTMWTEILCLGQF